MAVFITPGGPSVAGSNTEIQYNDNGGLGASPDFAWDDIEKELDIGGDVNLDDGSTYRTIFQVITPTANRTISFPDRSGTLALVGGFSGQLIYNDAGAYAGGPLYDSVRKTLGYPPGQTVTQATSKSTGVTLNGASGRIITSAAALAANTTVTFALTNSSITANDLLLLNTSDGTAGAYALDADASDGFAVISIRNITSDSLSQAITIGFAIIKS